MNPEENEETGKTTFIHPDTEETVEEVDDNNEPEEETVEEVQTDDDNAGQDVETIDDREVSEKSGFEKSLERKLRKIARLEAENAALKSKVSPSTTTDTPKPTLQQFNGDIEKYIEAVSEWTRAETIKEFTQNVEFEKKVTTWAEREKEFEQKTPDYREVIEDFKEDMANVYAPEVNFFINDSKIGPQMWYHLATHREDIDRIINLSPLKRVAELGKLEEKLSQKTVAASVKQVSSAPKPVKKETGSLPVTEKKIENMSQSEYREYRQKQLQNRRR